MNNQYYTMIDPMYYEAIKHNNIGIQSMKRNEYEEANRSLQTSLQYIKELIAGSSHCDQLYQEHETPYSNDHKNICNTNIRTCPPLSTTTMTSVTATATTTAETSATASETMSVVIVVAAATAATPSQTSSSFSSSCTDFNDTMKSDSISLTDMKITSTNTKVTANASATMDDSNMTHRNEKMNKISQFRPILLEIPTAGTLLDTLSTISLSSTRPNPQQSSNHHRMNGFDILSCIILYNMALCCIYRDMHKEDESLASSSSSNGDNNTIQQHVGHTPHNKCYLAFRLLVVANTTLREILSTSLRSIEEDTVPLWFAIHRLEYRILLVLIYLIRDNHGNHNNHQLHMNLSSPSSPGFNEMIQRFNYVQKIENLDKDIIHTLFETKKMNVAPCA